jgi:hypothetical protein
MFDKFKKAFLSNKPQQQAVKELDRKNQHPKTVKQSPNVASSTQTTHGKMKKSSSDLNLRNPTSRTGYKLHDSIQQFSRQNSRSNLNGFSLYYKVNSMDKVIPVKVALRICPLADACNEILRTVDSTQVC